MHIVLAVATPILLLLTCIAGRRIQSLPFVRSLALARGGDMRGIALQTIIVMVVLLAIAGGVAAVLLARAGQETSRLEEQSTGTEVYAISNDTLCRTAGHTWAAAARTGADGTADAAGLLATGGHASIAAAITANGGGYCHPS